MRTRISEGDMIICREPMYERYGVARVLEIRRDLARVEYVPDLFSSRPLLVLPKIVSVPDSERVPSPLERAVHGQWGEPLRFDLKQMAARFLTENKAGRLSHARTDLLPHQTFPAHEVVTSVRRRFLLADDVGLGKTVEVGMIWQSLYRQEQADRTLIICPAGLAVQWHEEMLEKFGAFFCIYGRHFLTINPRIWNMEMFGIAAIECLKHEEYRAKLLEGRHWDLIILDEAHRFSGRDYRDRDDAALTFRLVEDLQDFTDALVLVTATPRQGGEDASHFKRLMNLLERNIDFRGLDEGTGNLFAEAPTGSGDGFIPYQDLVLRTPKLNVTDADGKRISRKRQRRSLRFQMFADEKRFHDAVSAYIVEGYKAAERARQDRRRLALDFVFTTFQKLAASSTEAIKAALAGRKLRLQDRRARLAAPEPAVDKERLSGDERFEGEYEESSAAEWRVRKFVDNEVEELEALLDMPVRKDRKLVELFKLIDHLFEEGERGAQEKILIFTDYRNTQSYLVKQLCERYGDECAVAVYDDGEDMELEHRRARENRFRDDDRVRFLVSTGADGEGVNMQYCRVCINYDLPWNPMRLEQRLGRVYRFGQTETVQVYNFRNAGTVEDRVYRRLERGLDAAAAALAGVTGEEPEEIRTAMLAHLQNEIDYNEVYKRTLVDGDLKQSEPEIREGIGRAKQAYEIATRRLFRGARAYSGEWYDKHLRFGLTLQDLEAFTRRYLQVHGQQVHERDGVLEFVTPEAHRGDDAPERYESVTFDRERAMRNPGLTLFGVGHEFVDAMLRRCGTVDFGGDTAIRVIDAGGKHTGRGLQFNFVIRQWVMRGEYEEFLFDFHSVFVTEEGAIDEELARVCTAQYSLADPPVDVPLPDGRQIQEAFETARAHLEEIIEHRSGWERDVMLLGVAVVQFQ